MSHFSYESALKALELCFENSELTSIEGVLDAAKQAYDFLVGESHHFKEPKKEVGELSAAPVVRLPNIHNVYDRIREVPSHDSAKAQLDIYEEKFVVDRILSLPRLCSSLDRLRGYESCYGSFDPKFDYLLNLSRERLKY